MRGDDELGPKLSAAAPPRSGLSRRWPSWLAALAVIVLSLTAAVWAWRSHRAHQPEPAQAQLQSLVAHHDGSAIATWLVDISPAPPYVAGWIGRFGPTGMRLWASRLPGLPSGLGLTSLAIDEDRVVVRYVDGKTVGLVALSLTDGHTMWNTRIADRPKLEWRVSDLVGIGVKVAGSLAFVAIDNPRAVIAVDTRTGVVKSNIPTTSSGSAIVWAERLLLQSSEVEIFTGATTITRLEIGAEAGCVVGANYARVVGAEPRRLVIIDARGAVVADRPLPITDYVLRCGRYGDRFVFLVRRSSWSTITYHVVILDPNDAVREVELGESALGPSRSNVYDGSAEHAPLSGELPRFVPCVLYELPDDRAAESRVVMIDLETAQAVWETVIPSHLAAFRSGGRWYLSGERGQGHIIVLDGQTGMLVSAADLVSPWPDVADVREPMVRGGSLWVYSHHWVDVDHLPMARLDAISLMPLFSRGIMIRQRPRPRSAPQRRTRRTLRRFVAGRPSHVGSRA